MPRPAGRGQPACAPFRAAGQVRLRRFLVPTRHPLGRFEISDEAVERRDVAAATPADPRVAERARDREGPRRIAVAGRQIVESQGPRRESLPQAVGRKSVGDPVEKRQRGLAGTAVGHRDPARERAGNLVLARELPEERGVDRRVGVQDLDVVEGDSLLQNAAERRPDLVLLSDGAQQACPFRSRLPPLRRVHPQDAEAAGGETLQETALEGREVGVFGKEVQAPHGGGGGFLGGPAQDVERIHVRPLRQRRRVAREDCAKLPELAPVGEGRGGNRLGGDPGRAQLLERALEGPVETRPFAQGAEIGARLEGLGAGLLDQGERLRPGEDLPALPREVRTHQAMRERANRLDPQVDPGMTFAGEPLDNLVADQQRGRDQNLLVERMLGADAGELGDQTGGKRRRGGLRRLVERKEGLVHHRRPILTQGRGQTRSARFE